MWRWSLDIEKVTANRGGSRRLIFKVKEPIFLLVTQLMTIMKSGSIVLENKTIHRKRLQFWGFLSKNRNKKQKLYITKRRFDVWFSDLAWAYRELSHWPTAIAIMHCHCYSPSYVKVFFNCNLVCNLHKIN